MFGTEMHNAILFFQAYDDSIAEHQDRITELIRENTRKTEQLNFLLNDKRSLEDELENKTKHLVRGFV